MTGELAALVSSSTSTHTTPQPQAPTNKPAVTHPPVLAPPPKTNPTCPVTNSAFKKCRQYSSLTSVEYAWWRSRYVVSTCLFSGSVGWLWFSGLVVVGYGWLWLVVVGCGRVLMGSIQLSSALKVPFPGTIKTIPCTASTKSDRQQHSPPTHPPTQPTNQPTTPALPVT